MEYNNKVVHLWLQKQQVFRWEIVRKQKVRNLQSKLSNGKKIITLWYHLDHAILTMYSEYRQMIGDAVKMQV